MPYFWRRPRTTYFRRRWRRPLRYRWPKRRRARKTFFRSRKRKYRRTKRHRRVRRKPKKKQFLIQKQWQPDNIRKCKIRGYMPLIASGQGRQAFEFIRHCKDICLRNYAYGGGFSHAVFSLDFLFEEFNLYRNYWSHTNNGFDLVRYTGCSIKFYRHEFADFVVSYDRNFPMTITKLSFASTYPLRLLLSKRRFLVPSFKSRPLLKKPYIKKKIKPPKLMSNKWFFSREFSKVGLVHLKASTISLQGPYLKNNTDNNCTSILCLNWEVFSNVDFEKTTYSTKKPLYYITKSGSTYTATKITKLNFDKDSYFFKDYLLGNTPVYFRKDDGSALTYTGEQAKPEHYTQQFLIRYCRYQPARDTGVNNVVFIESTHSSEIEIPQQETFKIQNIPLYITLFGFIDWMDKYFHEASIYDTYCLAIKSDFIYGSNFNIPKNQIIIPISVYFQSGQGEYGSPPILDSQDRWLPTIRRQLSIANDIVNTGPYAGIPTGKGWDLPIEYTFYFKWGGTVVNLQNVQDPAKQETFPVPSDQLDRIQIKNPGDEFSSEFHHWDYRRGLLTKKALKRVLKDLRDRSLCSTDSEEPTRKRKRAGEPEIYNQEDSHTLQVLQAFKECLSKEEEETPNLQQLHKQQLHFQRKLLRMIHYLHHKQRDLSIMTGQLE
nr:MAG: ORF1 [Torque teno midi virus]